MIGGAVDVDVDRIARAQGLGEGLRTDYPNVTGYTLGFHAQPRTSDFTRAFLPTSNWMLLPGMVFHMWIQARGMAFRETVLVREQGPERLTGRSGHCLCAEAPPRGSGHVTDTGPCIASVNATA